MEGEDWDQSPHSHHATIEQLPHAQVEDLDQPPETTMEHLPDKQIEDWYLPPETAMEQLGTDKQIEDCGQPPQSTTRQLPYRQREDEDRDKHQITPEKFPHTKPLEDEDWDQPAQITTEHLSYEQVEASSEITETSQPIEPQNSKNIKEIDYENGTIRTDINFIHESTLHGSNSKICHGPGSTTDFCKNERTANNSKDSKCPIINTTDVGLNYRPSNPPVCEETDSDTSSSSESSDEEFVKKRTANNIKNSEPDSQEKQNVKKATQSKDRIRSEGEIFPEELQPLEYLTLSPDETVELEPLGVISGIVDVLVVIKAFDSKPALFDDSVLFLEDRSPLGLIFEVFGTVERSFYSVRFNSRQDIKERGFAAGDKVLYAPKADNFTKYVFIAELRKMKCDDASWENDNEPPPGAVEYSDDEEERRVKRENKKAGVVGRKKKRKKQFSVSSDGNGGIQGPQLLEGDLMKNPFGDRKKTFQPASTTQWPPNEPFHNNKNASTLSSSPQIHQHSHPFTAYSPRPQAVFGEGPGWQSQPGVLGRRPGINNQSFGNPNPHGSFFNNRQNQFQSQMPSFASFGNVSYPPGATPFMGRGVSQQQMNHNSAPGFTVPPPFPPPLPPPSGAFRVNSDGVPQFPPFNCSQPPPPLRPNFSQPPL